VTQQMRRDVLVDPSTLERDVLHWPINVFGHCCSSIVLTATELSLRVAGKLDPQTVLLPHGFGILDDLLQQDSLSRQACLSPRWRAGSPGSVVSLRGERWVYLV
jgi:hypothetical protein